MEDGGHLVRAWRQGDEGAGQRLFERYYATVERFFANKVDANAPALIEQTFVRLREDQNTEAEADELVEVLRNARSELLDYLRQHQSGPIDPSTQCVDSLTPVKRTPANTGEAQQLREALRRLPIDDQILLELHLWEQLEPRKLAAVVDRSPHGLDALIQSAERRLADLMEDAQARSIPTLDRDVGPFVTPTRSEPANRVATPPNPPGRRLGQYTLVRWLGAGGMGEVFEAQHIDTGERVALKQLSKVDATGLYRFKREFRALADVSHPNLVRLGELVVPTEGAAFFTMELLDGISFVKYVRAGIAEGQAPDSLRLRRAFRQLVAGVIRMHEAECIHRDLKPSNVMVTSEGRVVILDFGLVAASDDPDQGMTRDGQVLGTPAYMAPEQAGPDSKSEAVDYYALGVILYESLTGARPFEGAPLQILVRKEQSEAPDPETVTPRLPAELRQLCVDLLAREPAVRPKGPQVLARLSGDFAEFGEHVGLRTRRSVQVPFIGRVHELEFLDQALHDVQARQMAVTVHLRATSGQGKTALAGELIRRSRAMRGEEVIALQGRCFERESVPYKGVDAVIDALAAFVRRLPEDEREHARPRYLGPLIRLFPVLDAVWTSEVTETYDHPPHELRRLGLVALREVLTRLGEGRVLVVHVDDFQWADEDGARLLGALVRPPESPAMLLVVSFRDEVDDHEALRVLVSREEQLGRDIRELTLPPMPDEDAKMLARALLASQGSDATGGDANQVEISVERANGNPFFLGELIRGRDSNADVPLDRVVVQRIAQLDDDARRLMAIVAIASRPIAATAVQAIFDRPGWEEAVSRLEQLALVARRQLVLRSANNPTGPPHNVVVEASHDRIRETVLAGLDESQRRTLHLELADYLEHESSSPEIVAEHLLRGGAQLRAIDHVERAAVRADDALAFGRAARLYRQALELLGDQGRETGEFSARLLALRRALARQLVGLGRCREAGALLVSLASEVPAPLALVLRAEAAEQLMHGGQVEEGIELASLVLRTIGEPPPRGVWRTLLRYAWERLRLWLRGIDFKARSETEIPGSELKRFDVLRTITIGMSPQQLLHSPVLHLRLLHVGLELGEPRRLAIPLAFELTFSSIVGLENRANRLESKLLELLQGSHSVEIDQLRYYSLGLARAAAGKFSDAADELGVLCRRLAIEPGPHWLRSLSASLYTGACIRTGRWRELEGHLTPWLVAARDRGNPNEIAELEGAAALLSAYLGDQERSREHRVAARSHLPSEGCTMSHYIVSIYETLCLLTEGKTGESLEQAMVAHQRLRDLNFVTGFALKREQQNVMVRIHLSLAMEAPADARRRRLAERSLRKQLRSRIDVYRVEALIGQAALCSLRGDEDAMRDRWRRAEVLGVECRLEAHLAAIRWRLSQVDGEQDAAEHRAFAEAHARSQSWKDPERIFDWLAPVYRR